MPVAYSVDLRQKVVEAYKQKEGSMRVLATRFKVSFSFVYGLLKRYSETGSVAPKPHGGGQVSKIDKTGEKFLKELIKEHPSLTLEELSLEYSNKFQSVGSSTIERTLKKLKITRKKKSLFDPRKNTPTNQEKRRIYERNIVIFDPKDLLFIDETGISRNITSSYARSTLGQRAKCENSLTRGTRISTIGALGIDGLSATFCYEGTLNAPLFEFWVEDFLLPILTPSSVIILDNASSHKNEEVIDIIKETGACILFLPPYSPELNPIENIWSKVKNFIKKQIITSTEQLYEMIAQALNTITPSDALNSVIHCLP